MFTKKDLAVGMIVELRDERKFMVMPTDDDIIVINKDGSYVQLRKYNEMLACKSHKHLEVIKVWGLSKYTPLDFNVEGRVLLWEREETKFHVRLPSGIFDEEDRYLNYSSNSQSYFFSSENELKSLPNLKTKFSKKEAEDLLDQITRKTGIVEVKKEGEKEWTNYND